MNLRDQKKSLDAVMGLATRQLAEAGNLNIYFINIMYFKK